LVWHSNVFDPTIKRRILLPPEEWTIFRTEREGLMVSFFVNGLGGHCCTPIDEGKLPENFVRLVGSEYEFVFGGLEGHPVGDCVVKPAGKDSIAPESGNSSVGASANGYGDQHALRVDGLDDSLDGVVKGVVHSSLNSSPNVRGMARRGEAQN